MWLQTIIDRNGMFRCVQYGMQYSLFIIRAKITYFRHLYMIQIRTIPDSTIYIRL